jgi:hypothetical protein
MKKIVKKLLLNVYVLKKNKDEQDINKQMTFYIDKTLKSKLLLEQSLCSLCNKSAYEE